MFALCVPPMSSLRTAVKDNRFRKDLYYRLNNFTIFLPPLLERKDDIPLLAEHFLQRYKKRQVNKRLAKEVVEFFIAYPWPGNIRELSNVIERACLLSGERQEIGIDDLPADLLDNTDELTGHTGVSSSRVSFGLDEQERKLIETTLKLAKGNKAKAARLLGIARKTLYEKLKRF